MCCVIPDARTRKNCHRNGVFFGAKNLCVCISERFAAIRNANSRRERSLLLRFGACCRELGGRQQRDTLFALERLVHKSQTKSKVFLLHKHSAVYMFAL